MYPVPIFGGALSPDMAGMKLQMPSRETCARFALTCITLAVCVSPEISTPVTPKADSFINSRRVTLGVLLITYLHTQQFDLSYGSNDNQGCKYVI
jgi:hypothetical protein